MKPSCSLRLLTLACCQSLVSVAAVQQPAAPASSRWAGSRASLQPIPEPGNTLPQAELRDATLRQIVHLTLGGSPGWCKGVASPQPGWTMRQLAGRASPFPAAPSISSIPCVFRWKRFQILPSPCT